MNVNSRDVKNDRMPMRYAERNARHRCWRLCLYLALLAHSAVRAADYELEARIGAPGSPMQSAFILDHNSPEAVTTEMNDPAIRKALAQAAGFKELSKIQNVQLTVSADRWRVSSNFNRLMSFGSYYKLKYPSKEARSLFPTR